MRSWWSKFSAEQRRVIAFAPAIPKRKRSSLEYVVAKTLATLGVEFKEQVRIGVYLCDFVVGNVVLEADGAYWHTLWSRPETEPRRDARLADLGYRVVRLSERELREDPVTTVCRALS